MSESAPIVTGANTAASEPLLSPVAEGILRARMPLPFPPSEVNVWLIEDGDGWAAIDAGLGDQKTLAIWEEILADPLLGGRPLTKLVVTHAHSDHAGAAGLLADQFHLSPYLTRTEWLQWRLTASETPAETRRYQVAHLQQAGCSASLVEDFASRPLTPPGMTPPPRGYRRVADGEFLKIGGRTWALMTGEGHSAEQLMLLQPDSKVFIVADQVLPRITPFVGVTARDPEGDPLSGYLASLERLRGMPADILALPSHGEPYHDVSARVEKIRAHHRTELDRLLALCEKPVTAFEAAIRMFRIVDKRNFMMAAAEALAHLRHLNRQGQVEERIAPDGVLRFARSG